MSTTVKKDEILELLTSTMAQELNMEKSAFKLDADIAGYGIDSLASEIIIARIEDTYGIEIPTTVLWDYPNLNELSSFIASYITENAN